MYESIDIVLRLSASVLTGAAIGINRDLANKPIGMRTLALVALGAAVVSLAGTHIEGIAANPDALSRVVQGIIQGVMAGISFIGAGVILRDAKAQRVEGLTTAATVWITAALGIACGLAAWSTVGLAVVLAILILVAGPWWRNCSRIRRVSASRTVRIDPASRGISGRIHSPVAMRRFAPKVP
jgi:putative Mg2+ transporter-C (MgtC) family protein